MNKIAAGEWYKDRNIYIEVISVKNDDWCDIHCMILRDVPGYPSSLEAKKFLHEWTKEQYTPEGKWVDQSITLLPDGPPQEILDALKWPSDGRGYRALPKDPDWK